MDERMDAPNGCRITDELREWIRDGKGSLLVIADHIDAAHERLCSRSRSNGYNDGFTDGFNDIESWVIDHEDEMAEHGWVRLPKDADGEYIHIGDELEHTNGVFTVNDMTISIDGIWRAWDGENGHTVLLAKCRHYHAPTVEDLLDEFVERWHDTHHDDIPALKAEYAAKLQLRGDVE